MHVLVRAHYDPVSHTLDRKVHSWNHASGEIFLLRGAQGHEGLSFPIFSFRMSNNFLNFLTHGVVSYASSFVHVSCENISVDFVTFYCTSESKNYFIHFQEKKIKEREICFKRT